MKKANNANRGVGSQNKNSPRAQIDSRNTNTSFNRAGKEAPVSFSVKMPKGR